MKRTLLFCVIGLPLLTTMAVGQNPPGNANGLEQDRLLRMGELKLGMTAEQVLSRQRRPDRITRVATAGQLSEQWIYSGATPVYVTLARTAPGGGSAQVVSVHSGQ